MNNPKNLTILLQGTNWAQKTHKLKVKFENQVNKKAQQAISNVKSVRYSMEKRVYSFFQNMKSRINSTVDTAIKDIDILRYEVPNRMLHQRHQGVSDRLRKQPWRTSSPAKTCPRPTRTSNRWLNRPNPLSSTSPKTPS
uniref:Uncharacterized protein n=1 Tax=Lygus hesperus TaxID=30085 RepID=A0A0K8T416_LYGHE